ncbi:MAG: TonB-dependent receptor [Acidobacteria bacterium]|nr:TonB-dependent receptor [Acidobacteriota bacterium]
MHAALSPVLQPFPSPGNPPSPLFGTQYFVMYDARQANLSNYPTDTHQAFGTATWSPTDRFAVTAHLRGYKKNNDKLNFAPWDESIISPSAELWFAPTERIDLMANYAHTRRNTETLFVMPVFDG